MRSHTFSATFTNTTYPSYLNLDATATGLDGITSGTPVAITIQEDIPVIDSYDSIITARVSALNTIRLRSAAPFVNVPVSITITELVEES